MLCVLKPSSPCPCHHRPRLFKIKSDIVFCVVCAVSSRPFGQGEASCPPRKRVATLGTAHQQEVPPRMWCLVAMAAPGRMRVVWLLAAARDFTARRSLHEMTPPRDVLLFQHERGRFFTVLGLFCAGQGIFWASLAVAALPRPPAPVRPPDEEFPHRGRSDARSVLWSYALAVGSGTIGKVCAAFPPKGTVVAVHA